MKFSYIILALPFLLTSCKKTVEKTSPVTENISESVYASGIVKTRNQYQVFSTVSGLISEILVTEGDTVKKDQPVMKVSNATSQLNTENAQLATQYAESNVNSDKLNELKVNIDLAQTKMNNDLSMLQRQRNLWAQDIGTKNEVDQRELAWKTSVTNYNAAILRYNDLKKQLSFNAAQSRKNLEISSTIAKDYTITSRTNGRVYSILKETGEMVNPQSPVAIIGDAGTYMLELQVDEYDIARIRLGQTIILSFDSYKGQVFTGKVTKIEPVMNERSRSFTIEAGFVTQPPALYPNLSAEANIIIQTKEKALLIPRSYLVDDTYVLLENKEKRKVTTGLKDYQRVEILSGLTARDVIIKPVQ